MTGSIDDLKYSILELKKIYPDVVKIVDGWAMMDHIHGGQQSESQKKLLGKFSLLMKEILNYEW